MQIIIYPLVCFMEIIELYWCSESYFSAAALFWGDILLPSVFQIDAFL